MRWLLTFVLVAFAQCQDVDVVLGQQDGVTQFTDLLTQWPDLVAYLNTGVHTRKFMPSPLYCS